MTLEIQTLDFKGSSIFSTLEGVFQKTLKPKTVESWSDRLSRAMAIKIAEWHVSRSTLSPTSLETPADRIPFVDLLSHRPFSTLLAWQEEVCYAPSWRSWPSKSA